MRVKYSIHEQSRKVVDELRQQVFEEMRRRLTTGEITVASLAEAIGVPKGAVTKMLRRTDRAPFHWTLLLIAVLDLEVRVVPRGSSAGQTVCC